MQPSVELTSQKGQLLHPVKEIEIHRNHHGDYDRCKQYSKDNCHGSTQQKPANEDILCRILLWRLRDSDNRFFGTGLGRHLAKKYG